MTSSIILPEKEKGEPPFGPLSRDLLLLSLSLRASSLLHFESYNLSKVVVYCRGIKAEVRGIPYRHKLPWQLLSRPNGTMERKDLESILMFVPCLDVGFCGGGDLING